MGENSKRTDLQRVSPSPHPGSAFGAEYLFSTYGTSTVLVRRSVPSRGIYTDGGFIIPNIVFSCNFAFLKNTPGSFFESTKQANLCFHVRQMTSKAKTVRYIPLADHLQDWNDSTITVSDKLAHMTALRMSWKKAHLCRLCNLYIHEMISVEWCILLVYTPLLLLVVQFRTALRCVALLYDAFMPAVFSRFAHVASWPRDVIYRTLHGSPGCLNILWVL